MSAYVPSDPVGEVYVGVGVSCLVSTYVWVPGVWKLYVCLSAVAAVKESVKKVSRISIPN